VIKLSRLDGESFVLNADLIRYVESRPDTFVTLTTGERIVVRESMDEVMERAVRYQQTKHLIPTPETSDSSTIGSAMSGRPALAAQAR
jgi:flagellar protein FlbD